MNPSNEGFFIFKKLFYIFNKNLIMIDFLRRLIGMPPILPNGYPDMAANHTYVDFDGDRIQDITRRMNRGASRGFLTIPPPPPIAQHVLPFEKPDPPMIPKIIDSHKKEVPREYPTTTSSLWCGSTVSDMAIKISEEETKKDPLALNPKPLKHLLVKRYPWILDVTEVRIRTKAKVTYETAIYFGPLEIHITVSPTHHSELMVPSIEKKVREKLYVDLIPIITCLYENNNGEKPIIIFSPSHSETILDYVK